MRTLIMSNNRLSNNRRPPLSGRANIKVLALVLVLFCFRMCGWSQGTMTVTFDNPSLPPNTDSLISSYSESGVRFWLSSDSSGGLRLVGAGNGGGSPNNGTTHLETYAGPTHVDFSLSPIGLFNLLSFDATESYSLSPGPETLHIVGYKNDMTASIIDLTTDGARQFQTFALGPSFSDLIRVSITPSSWDGFALDNVVISGVPEPSAGGLLLLAAACAFGRSRIRRRRP
jgi:hypothetical protein